ncbi:MAG: radical SAM protein [Candidatus Methanofastidiosa archaeon]|nr:radical SAM protein [Candidatus Methanofastidiosa archaeon]
MSYKYLFGPVPSRRLGTSLGIDIIPYKTCTLNCVYCECGNTTELTVERKEYTPTGKVIAELDDLLSKGPHIDYLTFSGSGEPTLHKGLGKMVSFLKDRYPNYKIALLTNGTLFYDPKVRIEVIGCDVILPSLDAGTKECLEGINRPHPNITIQRLVEGLKELRKEFKGEIWLEVLIVPGMNDGKAELEAINKHISEIRPDKVQINSLDRPATEIWVEPVDQDALERIADYLGGEIIGRPSSIREADSFDESVLERIISTIRRRPCTTEDLTKILNVHVNEVNKYLNYLEDSGKIESERRERGIFFKMKR